MADHLEMPSLKAVSQGAQTLSFSGKIFTELLERLCVLPGLVLSCEGERKFLPGEKTNVGQKVETATLLPPSRGVGI